MIASLRATRHLIALTLAALLAMSAPVRAQGQDARGTVLLVSDIHFDPFAPPALARALAASDVAAADVAYNSATGAPFAPFGQDTNPSLLASALAAIAKAGAAADFAIVPGDVLAHEFEKKAAALLGVAERSGPVQALAVETTRFVARSLGRAMGGKPVIVALGNDDSACGDYQIEPDGGYLAQIRETVRRLAGADRVDADFNDTYARGGWYGARHPTLPKARIFVVNDVLWSTKYRDACGSGGRDAGIAMMTWLTRRLAEARTAGERVWLVHHIPVGIDPYSTVHSRAATCPARVVPFLKEPFASQFEALLRDYSDVIRAIFSGHVHMDTYRLITGAQSNVVGVDKVVPAISPIFGQNSGFQIYTYDRTSGAPTDFSTWYLANRETASPPATKDWRIEYTFSAAYAQPSYSPDAVAAIWKRLSVDGATREAFRRFYPVSRGELRAATLPAYACAIGHLDRASFTACYCGR